MNSPQPASKKCKIEDCCVAETKQQLKSATSSISNHGGKNQDIGGVFTSPCGTINAGFVLDGHGDMGAVASKATNDSLLESFGSLSNPNLTMLYALENDEKKEQKFFDDIFSKAHDDVRNAFCALNPNFRIHQQTGVVYDSTKTFASAIRGGCTLTIVIVILLSNGSKKLLCANVGDSEALLVLIDNNPDLTNFTNLTEDHSPESSLEYERICKQRVELDRLQQEYSLLKPLPGQLPLLEVNVNVFAPDGSKNKPPVGSYATTVRSDLASYFVGGDSKNGNNVCIAMGRAIGNFYAVEYGLTSKPSMTSQIIPSGQQFVIIIASDGLWDCEFYGDYVARVRKLFLQQPETSLGTKTNALCEEAVVKGKSLFGDKSYDDTTIVIIEFK